VNTYAFNSPQVPVGVTIWVRKARQQTMSLSVAASYFYQVLRHAGRVWLGNSVSVASLKVVEDPRVYFLWCRAGNAEQNQSTQHSSGPFTRLPMHWTQAKKPSEVHFQM
jgi:hypothetical protein